MNTNSTRYITSALTFILFSGLVLCELLSDRGSFETNRLTEPARKTDVGLPETHGLAANTTADDQTLRASTGKTLLNSPLNFEANQGQFDSSVVFGARAAGADVYLGVGEALFAQRSAKPNGQPATPLRMRM
ncbi:MAG TPA: hypothetical protein VKG02_18250, partial [Blastocatellia bacterium]|nr:hypothetical protein [Blastocatellia bacterium]